MERRRGVALEAALLDAAWEQLQAGGYPGFTFEAIAERAGTSKPVLYRRWATREALVVAMFVHQRGERPPVPDTGSLREDVLTMLRSASQLGRTIAAVFSVHLGAFFSETGKSPAILRREMLGGRATVIEEILVRAVARGEVRADLPKRVVHLPFDLYRHEAMMTLEDVPDSVIVEIVDEIFLPLVTKK